MDDITDKKTNDQMIHAEAIERFALVEDKEQRLQALDDMRFTHVEGGQWDDDAIEKRANRPRFTVNRLAGAVSQVVGDQRQNRTSIKVRPVSSGADEKIAKIFNGLIRNIESGSKATNAYDAAFDEAVTGGYGGWRIITEYADDDVFEQDIKIQPINSAASSLYFGESKEYDKRDAKYAFLVTVISEKEFKSRWPSENITSFSEGGSNSACRDWFSGDTVKIAEYWTKIPVTKKIALLSDGRVINQDEEQAVIDELKESGVTVIKTRSVKSHKVAMYLMSGSKILEPVKEWSGKYIPLVPLFGKVHHIEGKTFIKGMIRDGKDPQRIYNYETSQAIETSALTPKDPYWMTKEMAAGHESKLRTFNTTNSPFMFYNPDAKHQGPPTRTGAPSLQQATLAMIAQASQDIHATTGLEPASMGNSPELKSGKAIQAQQAMGDRGSFIYSDNLHKSIQYTGEILVDLIPRIYDTQRTVRVLNADGSSELMEVNAPENRINQTIMDSETGRDVIVNDLTVGKYDVVTDSGASFATKRTESAAQLIELAQSSPQIQALAMDLIVSNMDINNSEELTKRVRLGMIKQGVIEPTEDEIEEMGLNKPQQPDPTQLALLENVQMETQKLMAEIENKEADTLSKQVKAQQETAKTVNILVETMLDKIKNNIPLTNDEMQLLTAQQDILADAQDSLILNNSQPLLNQPLQ